MDKDKENRYSVPALAKSLTIIETMATGHHPLGISDLVASTGFPKSTVFTILSTLEACNYAEKNENGKYALTLKLYDMGVQILNQTDIREAARPIMEELAEQLGFTVHMATLINGKAVYNEKVQSSSFVQFSTQIGQSWHVHISGVGKAIAAYLPESELDKIIQKHGLPQITANSISTAGEFKAYLANVRQAGYAIEDEEGELGIRCVAAPIFDRNGKVVASVSVTGTRLDLPSHRFAETGNVVKEKALLISKKLGYRYEKTGETV